MSYKDFVALSRQTIPNISCAHAREVYQSIHAHKNKIWFDIHGAQCALQKKNDFNARIEYLQTLEEHHKIKKLLNKKSIVQLIDDIQTGFSAKVPRIPNQTDRIDTNDESVITQTISCSNSHHDLQQLQHTISDMQNHRNTSSKNKWQSQMIRKMICLQRKLGHHYRKKQNKTWKHKLDRRRRSKQCKLKIYNKTLTDEHRNCTDYTHSTITQHQQFLSAQQAAFAAMRKKYGVRHSRKRCKYKHLKRNKKGKHHQKKKNHQRKRNQNKRKLPRKKRPKENLRKSKYIVWSTTTNVDTHDDHNQNIATEEPIANALYPHTKNALEIECKIMFCHNGNDKKAAHSTYKLMKAELTIFDRYKREWWTSFELIPCIKRLSPKQFTVRRDLDIEINNKTDTTIDDNYSFYYIAQYCYEIRTPYIEYELQINKTLRNPLWKLSHRHDNTEYHNKFMLNYSIEDILHSQQIMLPDDIMRVLFDFVGYSNIAMTFIEGVCEYNIHDKANYIRHELVSMKNYAPPYVKGNNIYDENGELLHCKLKKKRLDWRKLGRKKFKQWSNIPSSMHGAIWLTRYIDEESGKELNSHSKAKYSNNQSFGNANEGTHWWKF